MVWLLGSLLPWISSRWQATSAIRHAAYSYYRARARAGRRGHGWGERAHHDLETCPPFVSVATDKEERDV